jgi:hypothetical protein
VAAADFRLPPGSWLMLSALCQVCGRRCYRVASAEGDRDAPADARAVIDLLGLTL